MATLSIPEFFSADAEAITAEMKTWYESATGKTLQPADTETFIFNAFVYREIIFRNTGNDAALQNLAAFSTFPILDYLAQNVGIANRLPAQTAKTKIEFSLAVGHPNMVIQAGTRVSHPDGFPVFKVIDDVFVLSGVLTIDVDCEATEAGTAANGFQPNTVNVLIDAVTDVNAVENTDITAGGSDEETDEQLRQRIYLAPSQFSAGGPIDAYKFFALSAHPSIIDVAVQGPEVGVPYPGAGEVAIYPLTNTVPTPAAVLDAVEAALSPISKRPCTDTVIVLAPTAKDYSINVELTLFNGADDVAVLAAVQDALDLFAETKQKKLGLDIVREHITALCVAGGLVDQVYKPNLISPATDISVAKSEFANCTGITLTLAGFTNG